MELIFVLIVYIGGFALAALLILSGAFLLRRERPRRAIAVLISLAFGAGAMLIGTNLSYENTDLIGTLELVTLTAAAACALSAASMLWPWPARQAGATLILLGFLCAGLAGWALSALMQANLGL
ncbi:MAG: hypothetical protein AAGL89_04665 [Pseudomonadota bacterium]